MSNNSSTQTTAKIRETFATAAALNNPEVQVLKDGAGWFRITVRSSRFAGMSLDDRDKLITPILGQLGLTLYDFPIGPIKLLAPDENDERQPPLPFWSDVLMEPAAVHPSPQDTVHASLACSVVAFYSFRGGVGRTTALTATASLLASQGYRVAIVDMDLEAPGITFSIQSDCDESAPTRSGVVDYVYSRLQDPDSPNVDIQDCISRVMYQGPGHGEIYVVPAGKFDESYVHKLSDISWRRVFLSPSNPLRALLKDLDAHLKPHVILIDSRTGLADEGAVSLFGMADSSVICLSPTHQNFAGLEVVLRAISKNSAPDESPNLLFVITPIPPVEEDIQNEMLVAFEKWLSAFNLLQRGETENEAYCAIKYNPSVATAKSLINGTSEFLAVYSRVAEFIGTGLPSKPERLTAATPNLHSAKAAILSELRTKPSPAAAQDLAVSEIPALFQRTGDFPKLLRPSTWLIAGAKGTGKSMLFRLFVETPEEAKRLSAGSEIQDTLFLPVHGKPGTGRTVLPREQIQVLAEMFGSPPIPWGRFWLNYSLAALCDKCREDLNDVVKLDVELCAILDEEDFPQAGYIQWIQKGLADPTIASNRFEIWRKASSALRTKNKHVWLFYDELDVFLPTPTRDSSLNELLEWWLESGGAVSSTISPRILLRRDIWKRLDFTNKSHYFSKYVELEWQEEDLIRLALRTVIKGSRQFAHIVTDRYGVTEKNLDNLPLEQLRSAASLVWGSRMGRTQKAYSHNWVRTRVSDSKKDAFPRSLSLLLETAFVLEQSYTQPFTDDCLLRPRALIDSLQKVSEQRVAEVRAEYPELSTAFTALNNQRSPIEAERLVDIFKMDRAHAISAVEALIDAGVIEDRNPKEDFEKKVFAVAELYLYGLGMTRRGQK